MQAQEAALLSAQGEIDSVKSELLQILWMIKVKADSGQTIYLNKKRFVGYESVLIQELVKLGYEVLMTRCYEGYSMLVSWGKPIDVNGLGSAHTLYTKEGVFHWKPTKPKSRFVRMGEWISRLF